MLLRPAFHAGRFYPAEPEPCREMIAEFLGRVGAVSPAVGAIVPHAGWVYSGATAAKSWAAVAAYQPETVVIFGAEHAPNPHAGSVFAGGAWQTPLGPVEVDGELAREFLQCPLLADDAPRHHREHAIEVQVPFVRDLLPGARIVPIGVRPGSECGEIGRFCAVTAKQSGRRVAFVASTDLTHYGPAFGFVPQGAGYDGLSWAKDVNDRRLINLIRERQVDAVVEEALEHHNACGSGAVAALLAAMDAWGGTEFRELEHATSAEVAAAWDADPENAVGYLAAVFVERS